VGSTELIDAAHEYLNMGLHVIALTGKLPNGRIHPHWKDDCFTTTDEAHWDRLYDGFAHPDTTGIGILTGPAYYVVDIDGEEGAVAWKALVGDDYMPDRWTAKTGRGLHLWFAHHESWGTVKLGEKLDFKGAGGYVAAPPSLHPDGHTYTWLLPPTLEMPPLELPPALEAVLYRRRVELEALKVTKQGLRHMAPSSFHDGRLYPIGTFGGVIERVLNEPEGNRNAVLYWAARTISEEGGDDEDLEALLDAAIRSGLARYEARRTIQSALDALGE
jgi:hypothetical protein